jgi:hypothetical protein
LAHALAADTLSAARLAWWRSLAPPTLDDRDALQLAYEAATAANTRVYLAAALALTQWELSCPVPLGPDEACRAPSVSIVDRRQALIRRDPVAVESARRWTALAKQLRRKARIAPTDIAALALLAELELAAHTDDYEALLITTPLNNHDQPSAKAMRAFEDSYARCRMAQHDLHRDLLTIEANLTARVLLREALHLRAHARLFDEHHQFEARAQRRRVNEARKFAPWRLHTIASSLLDSAADLAERCVAIGTDAELLAACESILARDPPPLHELVPEPRSTSVMHTSGVVGPELL